MEPAYVDQTRKHQRISIKPNSSDILINIDGAILEPVVQEELTPKRKKAFSNRKKEVIFPYKLDAELKNSLGSCVGERLEFTEDNSFSFTESYQLANSPGLEALHIDRIYLSSDKLPSYFMRKNITHNISLTIFYNFMDHLCQTRSTYAERGAISRSAHMLSVESGIDSALSIEKSRYMTISIFDIKSVSKAYMGWRNNSISRINGVKVFDSVDLIQYKAVHSSIEAIADSKLTAAQFRQLIFWAYSGWQPNKKMINRWIDRQFEKSMIYTTEDFMRFVSRSAKSKKHHKVNARLNDGLKQIVSINEPICL
jgi:hypothetical protein